jgi:hypothetical protein
MAAHLQLVLMSIGRDGSRYNFWGLVTSMV